MDSDLLRSCQALVPLGPWLELCELAEVSCVPAEFSQPFPVRQILGALDGDRTPELDAAFEWLKTETARRLADGERISARWECCSSEDAKHAAGQGRTWGPDFYELMLDDCRVKECTVGETTRLCIRPWVEALRFRGYPVEFRFFQTETRSYAVSSYYPQRALSSRLHLGYADRALVLGMELAHQMMSADRQPLRAPYGFSADFIVQEDGEVLFLEGGPPHIKEAHMFLPSAHPCCFAPGEIHGIALAPRKGALTK